MPYQGAGATSDSGNGSDVIQDGGRKRKLLLLLDGASKTLSIPLPLTDEAPLAKIGLMDICK